MISRCASLALVTVLGLFAAGLVCAGNPAEPAARGSAFVLHLPASLTEAQVARFRQDAEAAIAVAEKEGIEPVLLVPLSSVSPSFVDNLRLAEVLADGLPKARTIGFISGALLGHSTLLALACDEVGLHPQARLGAIGHGDEKGAIPRGRRVVYADLAERRNRPAAAVAQLLDDPQRVLTADEARAAGLADKLAESPEALAEATRLRIRAPLERAVERAAPQIGAATAVVIHLDGPIDPLSERFVVRKLEEAKAENAKLVIIEIDSPGGLLEESLDLANRLADISWAHTVAYVPRQALSGAAFVALGCNEVLMGPDARIGDAGPIFMGEDALFHHAPEKIVSDLVSRMRRLAERTGRPMALVEAMIDRNAEVFTARNTRTGESTLLTADELAHRDDAGDWEKGALVFESRKGHFLTVTGDRAVELGLAEQTIDNAAELRDRFGLTEDPRVLRRTWVDTMVFILALPIVSGLLLAIAIVCLYVELHAAGFGIAGLLSGLCFALFFWGRFLGGTAGWLEVVLFVGGVICLGLEFFVIPGFGVTGVTGALLVLVSLILAGQTFIIPRRAYDWQVLGNSVMMLAVTGAIFAASAMFLSRYFDRLPIFGRMMLAPPPDSPPVVSSLSSVSIEPSLAGLLGQEGVTSTPLRPAGKARFDREIVDVVAEGNFLEQGIAIKVIEVVGNRVVVAPTRSEFE